MPALPGKLRESAVAAAALPAQSKLIFPHPCPSVFIRG
jgi:hypothetical protein